MTEDRWLTLEECSEYTGYTQETLRKRLAAQVLPASNPAGIRIKKSKLDEFMESHPYTPRKRAM